jgi:transposase, IS5 family
VPADRGRQDQFEQWNAADRGGSKTPQRHAYERSAAFKQGQRFRAGIEGRISVLMRGRGIRPPKSAERRGRWSYGSGA